MVMQGMKRFVKCYCSFADENVLKRHLCLTILQQGAKEVEGLIMLCYNENA